MIKYLTIITFCTLLASCSSEVKKTTSPKMPINIDKIYSSKINGIWNCEIQMPIDEEKNKGTVKIKTESSYISNGRFNTFGTMVLENPEEKMHLEYSLLGTGKWEVKDKKLFEILEDMKIVNTSDPLMDKFFNLTDMFPKNVSESSTILSLSKSNITLESDSSGDLYSCSKKKRAKKT